MRNAGMDGAQAGIKIAGITGNNTTFMVEIEEELKSLLMRVKKLA